ncbi:MAG TPA: diaminopimelate epimerase [Solirubrobacteraceae bacterium]|nr:diaminopimelate epimerase [Solirubrobacteraceae bacterium]
MRFEFEKWQALGNDYLIVEAQKLPFELTSPRVRALCEAHTGVGADGVLELSHTDQPGLVARLRIFNPDGSEAELSGNGVRQAVLYLRRHGWAQGDSFSIETAAGEVRPRITGETTAIVDMGRASLRSNDFPDGPDDGQATLRTAERDWSFQHVSIGNPQCAIRVSSVAELEALAVAEIGPAIETHELFPNRSNVSWWADTAPARIRARIFERGVGETRSSGTGATGAAVAHMLLGGDSPVTVALDGGELEVEVSQDLHVTLSGWAVPVFAGTLADRFVEELHEIE